MKLNNTTLIAALALGSLLTLGTAVNAQTTTNAPAATPPAGAPPANRPPRGGMTLQRLTQQLALTDDQKPKVQAVLDDQNKQMMELRQDTALSPEDRRTKMAAIRTGVTAKFKEILTPEQFDKYQKMPQPGVRPTRPPGAPAAGAAAPAPAPAPAPANK
jgi:Spy/CpxP family protein refolding chaperone